MAFEWYFQNNGKESGPVSPKTLLQLARDGYLNPDDFVRRNDMEKWQPARKVKGLTFPDGQPGVDADSGHTKNSLPERSNSQKSAVRQLVESAVTESGKSVQLFDDGTWHLVATPVLEKDSDEKSTSIAVVSSNRPQSTLENSFRQIRWGYSEREVRDSEASEPIHEHSGALFYEGRIADFPCRIIYVFAREICVRAKYSILEEHSNENLYLDDYFKLKELLLKKYGRPVTSSGQHSDFVWLDSLFQDDESDWGRAVAAGHLALQSQWETEDTCIDLVLHGDNFEISLAVEYWSKEMGHLEEEEKHEQHLGDL
ncbi:hypothetical protein Mal52_30170 [Symmachiella dynata]|uniref:GYF domain-containing protein n=1 Tax=Symmachiella dynata TaxID=2527995 RepID=A0A517ZPX9_9PLAN|nr:DUF4339 domain-containing protein [Symmachiella dynata]QDU44534.1 hypothetical protein Mal52_30170 [Symmachiella dynata]